MKCLLALLLFLFTLKNSFAQFVEKIYLKDSITVYTGWIVEQVPQDYIKILRLKEKDTIQVQSENIWKIIRVIDTKNYRSPFNKKVGRNTAIYLEGLGNGIFYSLNYDTRLKRGIRDGWGIRAGFGLLSIDVVDTSLNVKGKAILNTVPVAVNYLIGQKRNALELGIGGTLLYTRLKNLDASDFINIDPGSSFFDEPLKVYTVCLTSIIGYRYTSLNNGFMFRAGLTPYIGFGGFNFNIGVSLGYHFQKT
jgi:hypothetical protein